MGSWKRVLAGVAAVVLVAGCSSQGVATAIPSQEVTPGQVSSEGPVAIPTLAPAPTPTPSPAGPQTFQIGDSVIVTNNGADWAKVTVSDVKVVSSYKAKYYTDKPKVAGNVFIQAKISYEAVVDGVDYNPFDWQVFCAGEAVDTWTLVLNGPQPQLSSGTLPKGRKASGFVVYEVAPKGEVRLSYKGNLFNDAPVFEVIIRAA